MNAGIASVEIERAANKCKVNVYTARPGMVIGKGGKGIETLKIGNVKTAAKGETLFPGVQRSRRTRSSSTSRRSARPRPTRSSSPRTSPPSSSAASPSAAR